MRTAAEVIRAQAGIPFQRVEGGIEGKLVTRRTLAQLEERLFFRRDLLQDQRVLNLGSGGSNLSGELRREGITDKGVDVDLLFDPMFFGVTKKGAPKLPSPLFARVDALLPQRSRLRQNLIERRRRKYGVADRTFVQADARHLPFADQAFDITFVNGVTYQLPLEAKEQVFRETLRVSKAVHLAPIEGREFDILQSVAEEMGYEMVFSKPRINLLRYWDLEIRQISDYERTRGIASKVIGINRPEDGNLLVRELDGQIIEGSYDVPGNVVILRRKDF